MNNQMRQNLLLFCFLLVCLLACTPKRALKQTFKDDFLIGAAFGDEAIDQKYPDDIRNVKRHFNAISTAMLEWSTVNPQSDVFTFDYGDRFIDFGEKNKMFTIGHGLVWHQMVPDWVFLDGNKSASRQLLLTRLRKHILTLAGRYKGRMGAWMVVNEAFNTDGTLRKSKWQEIIGDDYIQKAFEYAREADPAAKLYYNDFGLFTTAKRAAMVKLYRNLKAKGVIIDGIGIQGHWTIDYPLLSDVEESIYAFEKLGIKLMITELDISVLPRRNTGAVGLGCDPLGLRLEYFRV